MQNILITTPVKLIILSPIQDPPSGENKTLAETGRTCYDEIEEYGLAAVKCQDLDVWSRISLSLIYYDYFHVRQ